MRVAIQGEPGSFSHEAAMKMVPGAAIVPCSLSADVFQKMSDGRADVAVIPIENSLAGPVAEHFDLLLANEVRVVAESLLRIHHNLIGLSGASLEHVDRVFSHPVALAQCKNFIARHKRMQSYAFYDTAGSVKQVVEARDRHAAAIASEAAAHYYGAQILAAGIEDNPQNYTRFFLVYPDRQAHSDPAANKVSLAFSVANRPGTLVAVLQELAALDVNMTKIESRPVQGKPWEYIFYLDCQVVPGPQADRMLEAVGRHCAMVKELGRYVGDTLPV